MSKLTDLLMNDLKSAMKNKEVIKKNVVTLIRSAIKNEEIKLRRELTADDELTILKRELKQTKDALAEILKSDRLDRIEEEKQKIAVIESYMPKQMSEDEVRDYVNNLGIDKSTKMGQAIGLVQKELKGKADGSLISKVVKEYLNS